MSKRITLSKSFPNFDAVGANFALQTLQCKVCTANHQLRSGILKKIKKIQFDLN